jgi:hypothetical protein
MIRRLACTANSLGLARLSKRADTLSLLCDTLQQDRLLDAGSLVIYDLIFSNRAFHVAHSPWFSGPCQGRYTETAAEAPRPTAQSSHRPSEQSQSSMSEL